MSVQTQTIFRRATVDDCLAIAQLMQIASDGVCDYIWSLQQNEFPGLSLAEIGAQRYAEGEGNFSYRNCVMAAADPLAADPGLPSVQGMMMSFGIPPVDPAAPSDPAFDDGSPDMAVLAPYMLEQPHSWYICALAVWPAYRGRGIGTQFLELAAAQARERGFPELSLLCFEQNGGALRLYQRRGFREVARTEVIPHPLIHHTGDILLLTKSV
jgi:ribosomal protein S18 acetylase RimI-like enzyme